MDPYCTYVRTSQVKKMAMTGNMSVVSREYERSIINAWKNFVAGDIVRMVYTHGAREYYNTVFP